MSNNTEFQGPNLVTMNYGQILEAMEAQGITSFPMEIKSQLEWVAIAQCVNQGIDSHLEAIMDATTEFNNGKCNVSPNNLCILVRRLYEGPYQADPRFEDLLENADLNEGSTTEDLIADEGNSLADSILTVLGFDDSGRYVGPY